LVFQEIDENLRTVLQTAISAWWTLRNYGLARKYLQSSNTTSSIASVTNNPEILVPDSPRGDEIDDDGKCSESAESFKDPIYSAQGGTNENKLCYLNQKDVNDLIRDRGLTKSSSVL